MKYRIEYAEGSCDFADNSSALIQKLMLTSRPVTDIRKLYKCGVSDSVMDIYQRYIVNREEKRAWT